MKQVNSTISYLDIALATMICLLIALMATFVYGLIGFAPGFFLPIIAAIFSAAFYRTQDKKLGRTYLQDESKTKKRMRVFAISCCVFGLILPLLFPNGSYDRTPWLVAVNATFLFGGMLILPAAIALQFVLTRIVIHRSKGII